MGFEFGELSAEQAERTVDVMNGRITEELTLVAGGALAGYVRITWQQRRSRGFDCQPVCEANGNECQIQTRFAHAVEKPG